jgi:CRP/FNR family transcriptional regulator, dissimilatory nitrate respiration regulator
LTNIKKMLESDLMKNAGPRNQSSQYDADAAPAPGMRWEEVPLFHALGQESRVRLESILQTRRLEKGRTLFMEGEACDGLYILLRGSIQLSRWAPQEGLEMVLHVVAPGMSFGEAALFGGRPFPATARALRDSAVAHFPKPAFLALLRQDPGLALALLCSQAQWIHRLVARLGQLNSLGASERVMAWLQEERKGRPEVQIQGTKKALSAQLGMSPETLSRALTSLGRQGLIQVAGRRICLLQAH